MIIIYDKANTLTLHYVDENKKVQKLKFVPGKQDVESKIWDAISEYNAKNMEHYERYLHPLNEAAAGDDGLDYDALNSREVGELVENTMVVAELEGFRVSEKAREKGPRATVIKAIDKQIKDLNAFDKKVTEGE